MSTATPAQSGGVQCRVPSAIPAPRAERPDSARDVRRMPIGGYTLALSWTPQYCVTLRGGSTQCDTRNGRFGFVLHGLWPEGKGAGWPQWCAPVSTLPREVLAANFCTMPSAQLMQHQWAKHGSCMAKRPGDYFDRARGLFARLRFPDMLMLAREQRLTAGRFAAAIARVNPGVQPDMLRVQASRYGMLQEVWLCLDAGFRPARCRTGKSGLSSSAHIRIRTGY